MNPPGQAVQPPPSRDAALARRLVSLADTLVDDFDIVDLLDRLVNASLELLEVAAAGLLLVDQRGSLRVIAASSEQVRLLELLQLQNDEGPCLDCVRTGRTVVAEDLVSARRWPRFEESASAAGFGSVLAIPMRLRNETIGGLNLFIDSPGALDEEEQQIAQALADVATIGILQQRSVHRASLVAEQLQTALNTRITIEQAKGVLAERGSVDMDAAFNALRNYSRTNNRKLSEVAATIASGVLDPQVVLAGTRPER